MSSKRLILWSALFALILVLGPSARAGEQTEPAEPQTGDDKATQEKAPPAMDTRKAPFFGDRIALYLEAFTGQGSASKEIRPSIENRSTTYAESMLDLDAWDSARASVGWKLPADHGMFLFTFNGNKETSYSFQSTAYQAFVINPANGQSLFTAGAVRWWKVNVDNGRLDSRRTTPVWNSGIDDKNGDSQPSPDEVRYQAVPEDLNSYPVLHLSREVPDNLQNRIQTFDLLYQRNFGGMKVNGVWSAGARYFTYEGNLLTAAWLNTDYAGTGFTDGVGLGLVSFTQDATGWGPAGSLGVEWHLWRNRVTLFGLGRFAFLLQSIKADSGDFSVLIRQSQENYLYPARTRLTNEQNKSSWHVGGDMGVRVRLLEGFHAELGYNVTGYQDCVLLPTDISIPDKIEALSQGTAALYQTRDIVLETWRLGFNFQF